MLWGLYIKVMNISLSLVTNKKEGRKEGKKKGGRAGARKEGRREGGKERREERKDLMERNELQWVTKDTAS